MVRRTRRFVWLPHLRLRGLVAALGLFLVLFASLACGGGKDKAGAASSAGGQFPVTIQQSDGQALTIAARPQRIVSLDSSATEVFCAIGAESQLVAVDRYANCPAGTTSKPALDAFAPNLEAIAGYRPDLVFVASNTGDVVPSLRRLGIPVLFLANPHSLDGVLDQIRSLGSVSGHDSETAKLIDSMKGRMDAVKGKLASVTQGPRVYHELDDTYYSAAPSSFVGDFYSFLKAQNIAAGAATDFPQLSAEVIVQRNPQVIVLADEAAGITADTVKGRPAWSGIDAVKNGRICVVDPDIVSRSGPRIVDALDTLAKCLYPDVFK